MAVDIDTKALRALAERATPGPWHERIYEGHTWQMTVQGRWIVGPSGHGADLGDMARDEDRAFVCAASPDVVLALLDRIEALEAEGNAWKDRAAKEALDGVDMTAEVERLRRIEEAARAYVDADDQDWSDEWNALEAALAALKVKP